MISEQRVLIYFDDVVNALAKEYGEAMDLHLYSPREILESVGSVRRAEAAEVVHGRWRTWQELFPNKFALLRFAKKKGFCSNCGAFREKDKYCPNCGARMDGGNANGQN